MKKKVSSMVIALCMLVYLLPAAVGFAEETVFSANTIIEAEDGVLNNGAVVYNDATASGGKIMLSAGSKIDTAADAANLANPDASYTVNVEQEGIYKVWVKALCPDMGSDSAWAAIDDSAYSAISTVVDTKYVWVVAAQRELTVGQHTIKLTRRETTRIDQIILTNDDNLIPIDYDGAMAKYVARGTTVSVYPDLLSQNISPVEEVAQPFAAGDRVAFIGDSITHGGSYHTNLLNYYSTRYPNSNFTYVNLGINGDTASGVVTKRLNDEVLSQNFNKAVILLGMNDMSRSLYLASLNVDSTILTQRQTAIDKYKTNMRTIVDAIQSKGWPMILAGPTCFDEWVMPSNKETSPGFNNVLRNAGIFVKELAAEKGCAYVDFNTPQLIAKQYFSEADANWSLAGDRVHPDANGHYVMALSLLKAQGESGEVATVDVAVTSNSVTSTNAAVTNLSTASRSVSYTYQPDSLPLAADTDYRNAEKLFPVTGELNREIIQATGIDEGNYNIKMNGATVTTVTSKDLLRGVNIADLQNNPSQQKSLHIKGLVDGRGKVEKAYRDFRYNEITYISSYNLDKTSSATLIASAQNYVNLNESNPAKATDVELLKLYIVNKQAEARTKDIIATYEEKIYTDNKPAAINVSIEYAGALDDSISVDRSYKYADVELVSDTVRIGTKEILDIGASANLSSISYQAGSLGATTVTGFNPMIRTYDVVLPLGTTTVQLTAPAEDNAAAVTGTGTVTIGAGTTTAVIGVVSTDGLNSKSYTIRFTVSNVGTSANLTSIGYALNGGSSQSVTGFNASTMSYTVDIPKGTTTVTLSAVAEDVEASVTGPGSVDIAGGVRMATITVVSSDLQTTKIYTINFNVIAVGNITSLVPNPNRPIKNTITYGDKMGVNNYFYSDRNSIITAHVPSVWMSATMIKLPLNDTRSTDPNEIAFLSGNNEYFNFTGDNYGVVYAISHYAMPAFTTNGWTAINTGTGLTYPITYNGTSYTNLSGLATNAPKYQPERPLGYLTWIEYKPSAGALEPGVVPVYNSARDCKYVYAKVFNANEAVSVPTMGVAPGSSNNYVVAIKWGETGFLKSNNAKLASLGYNSGTGVNTLVNFNAATTSYDVELPITTSSVSLVGTAQDIAAQVTYDKASLATFPGSVTATVTAEDGTVKTYTVNFTRVDVSNVPGPGNVYNLKYRGVDAVAPFAAVTGVQGTAPINIVGDNVNYPTQADKIAAATNSTINLYKNDALRMYSDRTPSTGGGSGSSVTSQLGSHMEFSYIVKGEEATSPEFISPNVTRILTKNDEKSKSDLIPDAYTFTIDKPAMVYIAWGFSTAPSANILANGWTLDTTGLRVSRGSISNIQYTEGANADNKFYSIPNGGYNTSTGIYTKHYEAGANVSIPSTGGGNSGLVVLIIWDTVEKNTITNLNITTTSNLNQTAGSTASATFRAVATPSVDVDRNTIEWYVNGVKQSKIGANFTYTPSAVGSYVVTAKVTNNADVQVNSKTIVVSARAGDINGDGSINISDVVMAAEIAVGNTYPADQISRANVSSKQNTTVDIADVVLILERVVNGSGAFPVEL